MRNGLYLTVFFLLSHTTTLAHASMDPYIRLLYQTTRIQYLQSQHPGFLGPVQVGRVMEILSPTTIKLKKGIRVRLLGIDNPLSHGTQKAHKCFATQMKAYLRYHLLGRLVILRQDRTDWDESMHLLRYVHLPGWDKHEKEIFFNLQMIEDGYAKPFFEGKNLQHQALFSETIHSVYKDPKGAWAFCLSGG